MGMPTREIIRIAAVQILSYRTIVSYRNPAPGKSIPCRLPASDWLQQEQSSTAAVQTLAHQPLQLISADSYMMLVLSRLLKLSFDLPQALDIF
jgi:hypothetical protein